MKILAIIINIFFPGFGTLLVKKFGAATIQIALLLIGTLISFTGIGAILGIPMIIFAWIWSLVTVVNSPDQPVQPIQVVVQQESSEK